MKHINLFNTYRDSRNAYYGDDYIEPWVSLTRDSYYVCNIWGPGQGDDALKYFGQYELFKEEFEGNTENVTYVSQGMVHLWEIVWDSYWVATRSDTLNIGDYWVFVDYDPEADKYYTTWENIFDGSNVIASVNYTNEEFLSYNKEVGK